MPEMLPDCWNAIRQLCPFSDRQLLAICFLLACYSEAMRVAKFGLLPKQVNWSLDS